jgi:hypothetical protein
MTLRKNNMKKFLVGLMALMFNDPAYSFERHPDFALAHSRCQHEAISANGLRILKYQSMYEDRTQWEEACAHTNDFKLELYSRGANGWTKIEYKIDLSNLKPKPIIRRAFVSNDGKRIMVIGWRGNEQKGLLAVGEINGLTAGPFRELQINRDGYNFVDFLRSDGAGIQFTSDLSSMMVETRDSTKYVYTFSSGMFASAQGAYFLSDKVVRLDYYDRTRLYSLDNRFKNYDLDPAFFNVDKIARVDKNNRLIYFFKSEPKVLHSIDLVSGKKQDRIIKSISLDRYVAFISDRLVLASKSEGIEYPPYSLYTQDVVDIVDDRVVFEKPSGPIILSETPHGFEFETNNYIQTSRPCGVINLTTKALTNLCDYKDDRQTFDTILNDYGDMYNGWSKRQLDYLYINN